MGQRTGKRNGSAGTVVIATGFLAALVFCLLGFVPVMAQQEGARRVDNSAAATTLASQATSPATNLADGENQDGENLVENGDFSQIENGLPVHWLESTWSGKPVFSMDKSVGHAAAPSVRIESRNGADASWSYRAQVQPHTKYRFSVWIKTEGLDRGSGFGALLNIHELQMVGKSEAVHGTQDWQLVATEFETGDHTELLLNLLYGGFGQSTGSVWFDDVVLLELGSTKPAIPQMTETEAIAFYETRIKPVIAENCAACHVDDPEDFGGGLGITGRASLIRGGDSGPAVAVHSPESSLLLSAINHESFEMPPGEKLPQENIDDIRLWLQLGMPWTPGEEVDHGEAEKKSLVDDAARQWWAFQKPQITEPPPVENEAWCHNEIDRFVLAKLEASGIQPAPPADRQTLIRRACYDLTGLPPTAEQVAAFVSDEDPAAWEKLVEQLLASPHYGEKWGRHWLDLVRYAESNSFERDGAKPYVWRYRDYVIRAFNDDKPYDQFLTEQLAGDELEQVTVDSVTATGYYRLGQWDDEPADPEQARFDELDDILATTSQTMLGLTVNCARCHDHKIDPVSQKDYYQLLAFFGNVRHYGVRAHETVLDASVTTMQAGGDAMADAGDNSPERQQLRGVVRQIEEIEALVKADFEPVEHEDFKYEMRRIDLVGKRVGTILNERQFNRYKRLVERKKEIEEVLTGSKVNILSVKESGKKLRPMHLMIRGNPHVEGPEVQPGFPEVFGVPAPEFVSHGDRKSSGARLALAQWIASGDNPMTARVMANRVWQYHFGDGIVRTSSDYGYQGSPPTHPELLDWLAREFVQQGWSVKHLHRQIMLSATYRMSGQYDAAAYAADPENELLWRFSLRRLTAEELRDSILMASGQLNLGEMFGPSVYPKLPQEVLDGQSMPGDGWATSMDDQGNRRSVYIHVKRSLQVPLLASHDMAETDFTCPVRFVTTQPTQALNMMNSEFSGKAAREMALLVLAQHPGDRDSQIATAFQRVTQRVPAEKERARLAGLVADWQKNDQMNKEQAMQQLCLLLLNLNEFVYLD